MILPTLINNYDKYYKQFVSLYSDYIETNWLNTRVKVDRWNVSEAGDRRTDNRTECQNNRLGIRLLNRAGSFPLFLQLASKEFAVQRIILAQMRAGGVFRKRSEHNQNREDKIADLQARRIDQTLNTYDFIEELIQLL